MLDDDNGSVCQPLYDDKVWHQWKDCAGVPPDQTQNAWWWPVDMGGDGLPFCEFDWWELDWWELDTSPRAPMRERRPPGPHHLADLKCSNRAAFHITAEPNVQGERFLCWEHYYKRIELRPAVTVVQAAEKLLAKIGGQK